MKKVLAIILSMVMLISSAVIITSAQETEKIDAELQKILEGKASDEVLDVYIWTNSYSPNATEMPSWPDKSAARKELKEYYNNWYNTEIVPVVFEGIEYEEVFVGSGLIIVSVKAEDIEKIASYDIVREIEFFDNGVEVSPENQEQEKIDAELQKILEGKASDEVLDVYIWTNSYSPNATEMPSWPDKSAARKELKEYYNNWYNTEIVPVVFEGIEYEEVFVGSGLIIVSVKAGDIEKIASYDIVSEVEYFENGVYENEESLYGCKDAFLEKYNISEIGEYSEYYELGEMDLDYDDAIDFVMIYAHFGLCSDALTSIDMGERFIAQNQICYPFEFCYGLFDLEKREFIPLSEKVLNDYPDISYYLDLFDIGDIYGDADCDGELSILDATFIQRALVNLEEYTYNEYLYDWGINRRRSDFDGDLQVTIMDATAIQKKLSKIE